MMKNVQSKANFSDWRVIQIFKNMIVGTQILTKLKMVKRKGDTKLDSELQVAQDLYDIVYSLDITIEALFEIIEKIGNGGNYVGKQTRIGELTSVGDALNSIKDLCNIRSQHSLSLHTFYETNQLFVKNQMKSHLLL